MKVVIMMLVAAAVLFTVGDGLAAAIGALAAAGMALVVLVREDLNRFDG